MVAYMTQKALVTLKDNYTHEGAAIIA